ncbi:hypothetical protein QFZ96_002443 [Paraburkholderia youngii]
MGRAVVVWMGWWVQCEQRIAPISMIHSSTDCIPGSLIPMIRNFIACRAQMGAGFYGADNDPLTEGIS